MASQPQTTISSEAEISREQRRSQEPSSEFALHVVPFESGLNVAESDSQHSIITVHVDSSESFLAENITQSTSSPRSQVGEEAVEESEGAAVAAKAFISSGSGLVEGERPAAVVVVGIVEPERADQPAKQVEETLASQEPVEQREQLQGVGEEGEEEEGEEEEDREAVGETRDEEGEETMEELGVEGTGHVKDATREQADTTQKFEEGTYIHGQF